MKNVFIFLLLSLFILNVWFVINESYCCTTAFLTDASKGFPSAGDFVAYHRLSTELLKQNGVYKDRFATSPPSFYFFFSPFVRMGEEASFRLWTTLKLVSILITGWLLALIILPGKRLYTKIIVAILISIGIYTFTPTQDDLVFGQINLFILCLLTLSVYLAINQKFMLCGIVLGLIFSIKLMSILIILYFAWKKNWEVIIPALITVFLLNMPVVFVHGIGIYGKYIKHMEHIKISWISAQNFSIYSQAFLYLHKLKFATGKADQLATIVHYFFAGIVFLLSFVLIAKNNKEDYLKDFSLLILCTLFLNPYHWTLHHIWVLIPFAYIFREILQNQHTKNINAFAFFCLFTLISLFDGCIIAGKWQHLSNIFFASKAPLLLLIIVWELLIYNYLESLRFQQHLISEFE